MAQSLAGGRRRQPSKGDLTEAAILDTAERLLLQRPLSAIGIDELAAGAGISRPSFYFHFASREAVLRALAGRIADDLFASSRLWAERAGDAPADAARRALEAHLALWRAHGGVMRAIVGAQDSDDELREFWTGVIRRLADAAAEQIDRDRESGAALPGPPSSKSLASAIIAMNDRVCDETSRSKGTRARDARVIDTLVAIWMRSVYGHDDDPVTPR